MVVAAQVEVLAVAIPAQAGVAALASVVVLAGVAEALVAPTLVVPAAAVAAAIQAVAPGEAPIPVALPAATLVRLAVVIPVVEAPVLTGDSST
jgi:hypothetical protein